MIAFCTSVARQAPETGRVVQPHVVVDDAEPHRCVRGPFEHDRVPAGELQHGRKASSAVRAAEPLDGIRLGLDAHEFRSPRARHERPREQAGCDDQRVGWVEAPDGLVGDEVEEERRRQRMPTPPLGVRTQAERLDRPGRQVHTQDPFLPGPSLQGFRRVGRPSCAQPSPRRSTSYPAAPSGGVAVEASARTGHVSTQARSPFS